MALKKKITAEEYGKLSDAVKAEYIADGDAFKLDIEGDEDTGPLKRALAREKARAEELEAKQAELEREKDELARADAMKNKDVVTLQKQWEKDKETAVAAERQRVEKAHTFITKQLGDSVAETLARDLTDSHALMLPHIRSRIGVNMEDGDFRTVVLDANGQPTALTVQDLAKEFRENKAFSAIMRVSKASGAAGGGSPQRQPAPSADGNGGNKSGGLSMDYRDIGQRFAERIEQSGGFSE